MRDDTYRSAQVTIWSLAVMFTCFAVAIVALAAK